VEEPRPISFGEGNARPSLEITSHSMIGQSLKLFHYQLFFSQSSSYENKVKQYFIFINKSFRK
jgi:hypothetical protein